MWGVGNCWLQPYSRHGQQQHRVQGACKVSLRRATAWSGCACAVGLHADVIDGYAPACPPWPPRVGLLGNPSDGYGGKTISVSIQNFFAEVRSRVSAGVSASHSKFDFMLWYY